jgi:hypothetical protein
MSRATFDLKSKLVIELLAEELLAQRIGENLKRGFNKLTSYSCFLSCRFIPSEK